MTAVHIVRPGEHVGAIARKYGYENFSTLWEHPENAALKEKRGDPMLLAAGDELFIPDRVLLVFDRATDASHDVKVHLDTLTLKLRLLDIDGEPLKNAKVAVHIEVPETSAASQSSEQELTTDGDGNLSLEVAKHVTQGSIVVDGVEIPLRIGLLDPLDTDAGLAQRLGNLGYMAPRDGFDADELRLAILDFQADNDLAMTGKAEDVRSKVEELYGG